LRDYKQRTKTKVEQDQQQLKQIHRTKRLKETKNKTKQKTHNNKSLYFLSMRNVFLFPSCHGYYGNNFRTEWGREGRVKESSRVESDPNNVCTCE
jgi:hypothetical protein